ncbi:MAG: alpha/beta hydrolase [Gammaproteobacteria bacterium]|jgi:fermentation-respiration switch protein FrsA (DUF1100 family)|nr:alpha/beta hydrolase [Gammaproteobacteria bacterium]
MWNGIALIALTLVAAYLILATLLYVFQDGLIYYPARQLVVTPNQFGLDYEPVSLETEDGVRLSAWYLEANPTPRGVLLFFHGNAGNISHRIVSLQLFNRLGLSTFIIDYRGFGESEGKPSEAGTYLDAEAAWRYLVEQRKIDPSQIVIFGRSLGAAIASYVASKHTPRALIIESAFTSAADLAGRYYPFMPVRWLTRFKYNTLDYVGTIKCPLLVVHSRHDNVIPFSHGRRIFDAAPRPKEFLEITGSHNDGFMVTGKPYEDGLMRFLATTE